MKRFFSILLVLCLVICQLPSRALAAGVSLKVTSSSSTVARGSEVTFDVSISENSGFNSITNMQIAYDSSCLRYVSTDVSGKLLSTATVNPDTGLISYAVTDPVTATGEMFSATFRVLQSAPLGSLSVGVTYDIFRVSVSNTAFADVNPTITPCKLNITTGDGGYERIAGHARTDTAAAISSEAFASSENVVLVDGNNFADALAGVSLAYAMNAPILLVRNSKLDDSTLDEIDRLGTKTVTILGGTTAISDDVSSALKNKGYSVNRIAGYSRFDTAVQIGKTLQEIKGNPEEVFFVVSNNFPDALAVSNVAALKGCPVLYIAQNGVLDDATTAFLQTCGASKATIIGGTVAINEAAEENIAAACGFTADHVSRIFGQSRYDTCLAINRTYAAVMTGNDICVATGTNYPDALAGGVFAAKRSSPMLLVGNALTDNQKSYLGEVKPTIIYVFGGTGAVSDNVAKAVVAASK